MTIIESGELKAKIDEYWSPFVSAWFPDGKDDANLTMLKLDLKDARGAAALSA